LKCCLISLAVLTFTLSQATAQDLASQIVGVWKVVDTTRKEVASGKIDKPYGEKPTGYYIYTRAGHFSWSLVAEGRKPPSEAVPTDAERVALFNTMSFGTGKYRVEGSKVVHRYDSFSHQAWTGTERTAQPAMSGAKMTVTSAPFKAPYYGCRRVRHHHLRTARVVGRIAAGGASCCRFIRRGAAVRLLVGSKAGAGSK
jgi:hypothetical protein